jgi:hypothetical protein
MKNLFTIWTNEEKVISQMTSDEKLRIRSLVIHTHKLGKYKVKENIVEMLTERFPSESFSELEKYAGKECLAFFNYDEWWIADNGNIPLTADCFY